MHACILRGTGLLKFLLFCGLSFALLFFNFSANFLGSAEQSWFDSFDRDSERSIIGRLIKSRQDGIFSSGGLCVLGVSDEAASKDPDFFFHDKFDNYKAYENNVRVEHFGPPYCSQICAQGMFYSILDALIPRSPLIKLHIFHGVASFLTALVLMAVTAWFFLEFGFAAGTSALFFAFLSQWLTVFGRSLWWSTWAFYLPMVTVMFYFRSAIKSRQVCFYKLGIAVFFSFFIKTLFNGYEYITTTLVMMTVPLVYYSILVRERFAVVCKVLVTMALSTGLAIAVSVCILSFQIASLSGNFLEGFSHMAYTFQKRTHLNFSTAGNHFAPSNIEGLKAATPEVVLSYLHGGFCSFDPGIFSPGPSKTHIRYYVSYARLIVFFALMTGFLYLFARRSVSACDRRVSALIVAAWFSILAPLSWFVVFKAHSYSHLHLNFIVWQMPFTFFGAAVTGFAIRCGALWMREAIMKARSKG